LGDERMEKMEITDLLLDIARKYGANYWHDDNESVVMVSDPYNDIRTNSVVFALYTKLIDIKWYHKIPFVAKFILPKMKLHRFTMTLNREMFDDLEHTMPYFDRTIKKSIDRLKQIRVDNFKQANKFHINTVQG